MKTTCPECGVDPNELTAQIDRLREELLELKDQLRAARKLADELAAMVDLPDSIKEALNSGDGTYRP